MYRYPATEASVVKSMLQFMRIHKFSNPTHGGQATICVLVASATSSEGADDPDAAGREGRVVPRSKTL
jgi:hypothetical protein